MNIFLIQTATQLLNAIEARHSLDLGESHLIILLPPEYPKDAYDNVVNQSEWASVSYLPTTTNPNNSILKRLKLSKLERVRGYFNTYELYRLRQELDRIAKSFMPVENVFLGNYWIHYMRHFAHRIRSRRLYLLDDGTATILINKTRKENLSAKEDLSLRKLKKAFIDRAIGLQTAEAEKVIFFTTYDLETAAGDEVIKNDYRHLRSLAEKAKSTEEIFFLGQTLIDEGFSDKDYLEHLDKVRNHYNCGQFIYIPHKSEPADRVEIIKKKMGIAVRKFNVPIEFQLSLSGLKPKVLASFCCSALDNCRIIFGCHLKIDAFYVDPKLFPVRSEFIRDIYRYFESKANPDFEIVRL